VQLVNCRLRQSLCATTPFAASSAWAG
jgi:hypothetical protein